jgi:zinc knuckle protein
MNSLQATAPARRGPWRSDVCYYCEGRGHWRRDCRAYKFRDLTRRIEEDMALEHLRAIKPHWENPPPTFDLVYRFLERLRAERTPIVKG